MKLFQSIRNIFAMVGVCPTESNREYLLSGRILFVYLCYVLCTTLSCIFLFYKAHNFIQYTNIAFVLSISILITIVYTLLIFKREEIFQVMHMGEKIIENSTWKFIQNFKQHFWITNKLFCCPKGKETQCVGMSPVFQFFFLNMNFGKKPSGELGKLVKNSGFSSKCAAFTWMRLFSLLYQINQYYGSNHNFEWKIFYDS